MVTSKSTSPDKPVFLVHQGAMVIIRLRIAAGSERGWVPLMISAPAQVSISVARRNNHQVLEVFLHLKDFMLMTSSFVLFWPEKCPSG